MTRIVDVLLAFLYPPACAGCGRPFSHAGPPRLCGRCRREMRPVEEPCDLCAEPGAAPRCRRCRAIPPRQRWTTACCVFRDGGASAELISRWKYGGDLEIGTALCTYFAETSAAHPTCYDLIVPVPLHRAKLVRRGFNQAALLARALCGDARGRFRPGVLRRRRAAGVQAALSRSTRRENVAGAFTAARAVAGRRILLVDDVLTSGATASACAGVLLDAGAARVDVAVLARTPLPNRHR